MTNDSVMRGPESGRRALFATHSLCGLLLFVYAAAIGLSGTVLVYRNELRSAFQPRPRIVDASGPRLTETQLIAAGEAVYPGHEVFVYTVPDDPAHAVSLGVRRGDSHRQILFDPYTGDDLGPAIPWGWRATTWLIEFHATLALGPAGRRLNGVLALLFVGLITTGLALWWPVLLRWRSPLRSGRSPGRRRFVRSLHTTLGAASFPLLLLWSLSGLYLTFPEPFAALADRLEPPRDDSFEPRFVDDLLYWVATVHFGRFGGAPTKLLWAVCGLAPSVLASSAMWLWWQRRVAARRALQR